VLLLLLLPLLPLPAAARRFWAWIVQVVSTKMIYDSCSFASHPHLPHAYLSHLVAFCQLHVRVVKT
jgi:hypothetical protein